MSDRRKCEGCYFCGYDPAPDCLMYCMLGKDPSSCGMAPATDKGNGVLRRSRRAGGKRKRRS